MSLLYPIEVQASILKDLNEKMKPEMRLPEGYFDNLVLPQGHIQKFDDLEVIIPIFPTLERTLLYGLRLLEMTNEIIFQKELFDLFSKAKISYEACGVIHKEPGLHVAHVDLLFEDYQSSMLDFDPEKAVVSAAFHDVMLCGSLTMGILGLLGPYVTSFFDGSNLPVISAQDVYFGKSNPQRNLWIRSDVDSAAYISFDSRYIKPDKKICLPRIISIQ